tara:strand:- start:519 stop:1352 length:834 start_codon:yes stop_codon:yes gene_type:complete
MKSKLILIFVVFYGCTKSKNIYPVSGAVIDINIDDKIVTIDHDSIPNLMMPMVMPFNIIDESDIADISIGDSIQFEFVMNDTFPYAKNFISYGKSIKAENTNWNLEEDNFDLKSIGSIIDDVSFLKIDNTQVNLSDSDGKYRFISFLFSRCPMPNMCPALVIKNEYLAKNLEDIDFIMISFDYIYDTPIILSDFYGSSILEYSNWDVWSSYKNMNSIFMLTKQVGCEFWGIEDNNIGHNMRSILIGPDRELIFSWKGDNWKAEDVKNKINSFVPENN